MDEQTDGQKKNNVAFAHLYHPGKTCSKFGKLLPVVKEEIVQPTDEWTPDGWTDRK